MIVDPLLAAAESAGRQHDAAPRYDAALFPSTDTTAPVTPFRR